MNTTRAAVQTEAREIEIRELPVPEAVNDGEALLRLEGRGICGADYERYEGGMDGSGLFEYPLIVGHEPVGRIEEIGADAAEQWGVEMGEDAFHITVTPRAGHSNRTASGT